MKLDVARILTGVAIAAVCIVSLLQPTLADAQSASAKANRDNEVRRLVVRLARGARAERVARDHRLCVLNHIRGTGLYQFGLPAGITAPAMIRSLSHDAGVVYAEPDRLTSCEAQRAVGSEQFHIAFDDGFDSSGYVNQTAYAQVDFTPGVTNGNAPGVGQGVIVALLDTGATFNHPALRGHYLPGINLLRPDRLPWDIGDGGSNAAVGHGTMVAGIIARIDPSAQLLPVKVLNGDGVGTVFNVVQGIYYAINQGAQVINMSMGTNQPSESLFEAVMAANAAGVTVVASAGNDAADELHYPACYPGVMGVASLEPDNTLSPFSNYGPYITAAAPGDGITSTYYTGGYATWAGTSFSAPFLTGMCSLFLEEYPGCDNLELRPLVWLTSVSIDALNPGYAGLLGAGILDVNTALSY